MQVENLEVGQVVKNYNELCLVLNMRNKTSSHSRKAQLKELARHCDFDRDGRNYIIKRFYDSPKEKIDGRGKTSSMRHYEPLKIPKEFYNAKGVYIIQKYNEIYIGSTVVGFRKRFRQHYNHEGTEETRKMLRSGGTFKILWLAANKENEPYIRKKEDEFIKEYRKNLQYEVINDHGAWSLATKNINVKSMSSFNNLIPEKGGEQMHHASNYFFAYNKRVSDFLKVKGIDYITVAQDPKTGKLFSLYYIDKELQSKLKEYQEAKV